MVETDAILRARTSKKDKWVLQYLCCPADTPDFRRAGHGCSFRRSVATHDATSSPALFPSYLFQGAEVGLEHHVQLLKMLSMPQWASPSYNSLIP